VIFLGKKLSNYLCGNWVLDREISTGEEMVGRACFQPQRENQLLYCEGVKVTLKMVRNLRVLAHIFTFVASVIFLSILMKIRSGFFNMYLCKKKKTVLKVLACIIVGKTSTKLISNFLKIECWCSILLVVREKTIFLLRIWCVRLLSL